jgi:hypothetical protein
MNVEQILTQVINLVRTWAKRIASLGLAVFVLLVVVKLFGFPTYVSVPSIGWQELGIFVAGLSYYLHGAK